MDLRVITVFVFGLLVLLGGGEALVRGSSRLAALLGLSPLFIGLTVVAFGTSAPELAVSVHAALTSDGADIAIGNVVGSNIFNVLFILGLAAIISPLAISRQLVRLDVPIMIAISLLLLLLARDGRLSRFEGILLFSGIVMYTVFSYFMAKNEDDPHPQPENTSPLAMSRSKRIGLNLALILVGLVMLVLGANWLIQSAVAIARALGVSELIIALTLVAAGTSLPELVTSIVASVKGERDIAVGNVVGSNIFNILSVLGLSSIIGPHGLPVAKAVLSVDLPVMVIVALACLPIFFTDHLIARWEGMIFFGCYLVYTTYLILSASHHHLLPLFNSGVMFFMAPLTVIVLSISFIRNILKGRRHRHEQATDQSG